MTILLSHLTAAGAVMASSYIPGPDGDFRASQSNFVTHGGAHPADLGLVAGDVADAGRMSHCMLRWISTTAEKGP